MVVLLAFIHCPIILYPLWSWSMMQWQFPEYGKAPFLSSYVLVISPRGLCTGDLTCCTVLLFFTCWILKTLAAGLFFFFSFISPLLPPASHPEKRHLFLVTSHYLTDKRKYEENVTQVDTWFPEATESRKKHLYSGLFREICSQRHHSPFRRAPVQELDCSWAEQPGLKPVCVFLLWVTPFPFS